MDDLGISTGSLVVRLFGFWLFCFKYLLSFILLVFLFRRFDSNSEIWYLFQTHLKKKCCTLIPSYFGNVSFATVTMAANSPQPTLFCVITLCVWLSSLYDQDVPFLDFVVLFIVVFVAVIVVGNHLLGMDWSVVIPLGTIICLPERGAGVGGVPFVRLSPRILRHRRCTHIRGESPIWKGLVCRNPSGHHCLPFQR